MLPTAAVRARLQPPSSGWQSPRCQGGLLTAGPRGPTLSPTAVAATSPSPLASPDGSVTTVGLSACPTSWKPGSGGLLSSQPSDTLFLPVACMVPARRQPCKGFTLLRDNGGHGQPGAGGSQRQALADTPLLLSQACTSSVRPGVSRVRTGPAGCPQGPGLRLAKPLPSFSRSWS